jgi:hypothetical protein
MSDESHVNPSPAVHQSMPSVVLAFCSPVRHLPDFTNCTMQTRHPAALARIAVPNAAVDFPFPSPVFTNTSEVAFRVAR